MRRTATLMIVVSSSIAASLFACGSEEEPSEATDAGADTTVPFDGSPPQGEASTADAPIADAATEGGEASDSGTTLDGGACGGDPVSLGAVAPQFAWKDAPTALTLTGTGFVATPKVYLRSADGTLTQIRHVAFVSSTSITAVVPAGLTAGTYEIAVINANTCAGTLVGGVRVVAEAPPVILDVAPATGTTQTDVPVTITGCHFEADAQLSVVTAAGAVTVMSNSAPVCNGAPDARCNGTPLCTMSGTVQTKTKALPVGAYLVRATNVARNTWGEFATFVVTNPSGNLGSWVASPSLVVGRRSLGVVAGLSLIHI